MLYHLDVQLLYPSPNLFYKSLYSLDLFSSKFSILDITSVISQIKIDGQKVKDEGQSFCVQNWFWVIHQWYIMYTWICACSQI